MDKSLSCRSKRRRVQEEMKSSTFYKPFSSGSDIQILTSANINIISEPSTSKSTECREKKVVLQQNGSASHIEQHEEQNWCIVNDNSVQETNNVLYHTETSSNDIENDTENISSSDFCYEIGNWATSNNITQSSLNGLLNIIRKHKCFSKLPKDARTILQTKSIDSTLMQIVEPGQYFHFGLANGIQNNSSLFDKEESQELKIVVGIDGLPIAKSTSSQFYPILAYIRPFNHYVFLIGMYWGMDKPKNSNIFLKSFVNEAEDLILNGIVINNQNFKVSIDVICCDTPAKSFILQVKGHAGYFSCTRCEIEGDYINNRTCFPYIENEYRPAKRTHEKYVRRSQEEYHTTKNISILSKLPGLDLVNHFSLDYMHLVCLGIVRKLIILWMKGPLRTRLPSWKINEISNRLLNLKSAIPCEFSRKCRKIQEVLRYKATELRTFLLYTGPIVLKNILSKKCYKHFQILSIAMTILLSPIYSKYLSFARELMDYFVEQFEVIYGPDLMSSNVHGLLHICDDYEVYGPLDNCCAFPFENYMQKIKKMLRKPDKPLEQIIKRYKEFENFNNTKDEQSKVISSGIHHRGPLLENITNPQFNVISFTGIKLKCNNLANSYFYSKKGEVVQLFNIAHLKSTGETVLIGKYFENINCLFKKPIKSLYLGICVVHNLANTYSFWHISDIKYKLIVFNIKSKLIAIPILHTNS